MNTDNKITEQELADVTERNAALKAQNADLKDFLKHLNNEIVSFLGYNSINKDL